VLKVNLSLSRIGLILLLGMAGVPFVMTSPSFSQTTPTVSPEQTAALKESIEHPSFATSLNNLASLYQAQGNIAQALAFQQ
jgi:hypothetical protein